MKTSKYIAYIFMVVSLMSCYINNEKLSGHYHIPYNGFTDAQLHITADTFLYEETNLCVTSSTADTGIGKYKLDKNELTLFFEPKGVEINEISSSGLALNEASDSVVYRVKISDNQLFERKVIDHIKIQFSGYINHKHLAEEIKITEVGKEYKWQYPLTINQPYIIISLGAKHEEEIYYHKHGIIHLDKEKSTSINISDISKTGHHSYLYGIIKYKVRNRPKEIRLIETYHSRGWSNNMKLIKRKR
ncbi:MAG: hypothetical protein MI974_13900 [Chitinophagales bacterium]|nr:hypothetical protein [Chitinophagales bacterium]